MQLGLRGGGERHAHHRHLGRLHAALFGLQALEREFTLLQRAPRLVQPGQRVLRGAAQRLQRRGDVRRRQALAGGRGRGPRLRFEPGLRQLQRLGFGARAGHVVLGIAQAPVEHAGAAARDLAIDDLHVHLAQAHFARAGQLQAARIELRGQAAEDRARGALGQAQHALDHGTAGVERDGADQRGIRWSRRLRPRRCQQQDACQGDEGGMSHER